MDEENIDKNNCIAMVQHIHGIVDFFNHLIHQQIDVACSLQQQQQQNEAKKQIYCDKSRLVLCTITS